jgi:hypothetical protein
VEAVRQLADSGRTAGAREAFAAGIAVAVRRGDKQAQREMQVFARRLPKS